MILWNPGLRKRIIWIGVFLVIVFLIKSLHFFVIRAFLFEIQPLDSNSTSWFSFRCQSKFKNDLYYYVKKKGYYFDKFVLPAQEDQICKASQRIEHQLLSISDECMRKINLTQIVFSGTIRHAKSTKRESLAFCKHRQGVIMINISQTNQSIEHLLWHELAHLMIAHGYMSSNQKERWLELSLENHPEHFLSAHAQHNWEEDVTETIAFLSTQFTVNQTNDVVREKLKIAREIVNSWCE